MAFPPGHSPEQKGENVIITGPNGEQLGLPNAQLLNPAEGLKQRDMLTPIAAAYLGIKNFTSWVIVQGGKVIAYFASE